MSRGRRGRLVALLSRNGKCLHALKIAARKRFTAREEAQGVPVRADLGKNLFCVRAGYKIVPKAKSLHLADADLICVSPAGHALVLDQLPWPTFLGRPVTADGSRADPAQVSPMNLFPLRVQRPADSS